MNETVITVQGAFSASYAPERATITLGVGHEGGDRATVVSSATETAELVRGRIVGAHHRSSGPILSWSSDTVQVWSERPWNQDGLQLDPVFHASVGFVATFSDFVHLSRFVDDVALIPGVTIAGIEWSLSDSTRSGMLAEVRSRAVKDAVAKASVYAQSIGLGNVRAIAIADAGMLNDAPASAAGPRLAKSEFALARSTPEPQFSLVPREIELLALVDARFVAS